MAFDDPTEPPRWYTPAGLAEQHPQVYPALMEEFAARERLRDLALAPAAAPAPPADDTPPPNVKIGHSEWILEQVLRVKVGEGPAAEFRGEDGTTDDALVLCKWLGRDKASWERNDCFDRESRPRERGLVDGYIVACMEGERRARERERERDADWPETALI